MCRSVGPCSGTKQGGHADVSRAHAAGEMFARGPSSTTGVALLHLGLTKEPNMSLVPQEPRQSRARGRRDIVQAADKKRPQAFKTCVEVCLLWSLCWRWPETWDQENPQSHSRPTGPHLTWSSLQELTFKQWHMHFGGHKVGTEENRAGQRTRVWARGPLPPGVPHTGR